MPLSNNMRTAFNLFYTYHSQLSYLYDRNNYNADNDVKI